MKQRYWLIKIICSPSGPEVATYLAGPKHAITSCPALPSHFLFIYFITIIMLINILFMLVWEWRENLVFTEFCFTFYCHKSQWYMYNASYLYETNIICQRRLAIHTKITRTR